MKPSTYPGDVVELPLDGWLYEAKPQQGCPRCTELKARLDQAVKQGHARERFETAREIRHCSHSAQL
jgi:hypothetical protein